VTFEEVEARRGDIFYMFDQNEDGILQSAEYDLFDEARAADMANMGGHEGNAMRPVDAGMMRATNDADGDGLVSREEFVGFSATWFVQMDRNGDGVITTDDFGRGRGNG
jgi:Ca2+-binding EF-hand superfamily protein